MRLAFFIIVITFIACSSGNVNKKRQFTAIEFFYFDNSPESFSLRITERDSIFLEQYVSSYSDGMLADGITYLGLLKGDIKQEFDSLVAVIDFDKLDSVYESDQIDGDEYKLYVEGDNLTKQVYIHSEKPPKHLETLKNLFLAMKRGMKFIPLDTTINFRNRPPGFMPPYIKGSH